MLSDLLDMTRIVNWKEKVQVIKDSVSYPPASLGFIISNSLSNNWVEKGSCWVNQGPEHRTSFLPGFTRNAGHVKNDYHWCCRRSPLLFCVIGDKGSILSTFSIFFVQFKHQYQCRKILINKYIFKSEEEINEKINKVVMYA